MRIATSHIYNLANNSMADANNAVIKTQEQLSSGKRVLNVTDDPVATTRIQQVVNYISLVEQYEKNIVFAENNLFLEETTLRATKNVVQRIKELAVQAGNTATLSSSEYQALANEVNSRINELVGLVNTRNANGDHIFSGYQSQIPAFEGDGINGFRFVGDEGNIQIKVDSNIFIDASDSGKAIFSDIPSTENTVVTSTNPNNRSTPPITVTVGTIVDQEAYDKFYPEDILITFNEDSALVPSVKNFTITERSSGKIIANNLPYKEGEELIYHGVSIRIMGNPVSADSSTSFSGDQVFIQSSSTQDVLATMMRFRDVMQDFDNSKNSKDVLSRIIGTTLKNLSNVEDCIAETMTKIGARINTLDSIKEKHIDSKLISNIILSDLSDLDYAKAASRLSQQTLILQAAQSSFLRITKLNLFNKI